MAKRKIYALYDNNVFMGNYTSKEISVLTGIPNKRVSVAASDGILVSRRYSFEEIGQDDNMDEKFWRDWDETRLKTLRRLRGGIKTRC